LVLGALSSIAHADALTKAQRDKMIPNDIFALMKKSNKRVYTGKHEDHKFLAQQRVPRAHADCAPALRLIASAKGSAGEWL
jgi:hypothetical protein